MKPWIFLSCCLVLLSHQSAPITPKSLSPQEAFFLRRVTEFWKDQDYSLAKQQIQQFLSQNTNSSLESPLYALLGDIAYSEKQFATAMTYYQNIHARGVFEKTVGQRAECLYILGMYDECLNTGKEALQSPDLMPTLPREKLAFMVGDILLKKMQASQDITCAKSYGEEAKHYLLQVQKGPYQDEALSYLASIHVELKEFQEAVNCYTKLSHHLPHQQEIWLMKALVLLETFNQEEGISVASRLVSLGGKGASFAAYQEMRLLFQGERFLELTQRQEVLEDVLEKSHIPLLHAYLSKSYLMLSQPHESIYHGSIYLTLEPDTTEERLPIYLTLLKSSSQIEDEAFFDQVLHTASFHYPANEAISSLLLLKIDQHVQGENTRRAEHALGAFETYFPHLRKETLFLSSKASFLLQTHQWKESRELWLSLIEQASSENALRDAWQSALHCSLQEYSSANPDERILLEQTVLSDLLQAEAYFPQFSESMQKSSQFFLGKMLFQRGRYPEALTALTKFSTTYQENEFSSDVYSLQTVCLEKLESDTLTLISIAQKALSLPQEKETKAKLHLSLFHAYSKENALDTAAEHLYQGIKLSSEQISLQDQKWLVNYYQKKLSLEVEEMIQERTLSLLKQILQMNEAFEITFNPLEENLEQEALLLSHLLPLNEKEQVLRSLLTLQQNTSFPWNCRGETLLELSLTSLKLSKPQEALFYLSSLTDLEGKIPPNIYNQAAYTKGTLLLGTLSSLDEESQEVKGLLTLFKDLQIQKDFKCEPLHLESGLLYVDLRISLETPSLKPSSAVFFLKRLKDDFTSEMQDQTSQYSLSNAPYSSQSELIHLYMHCVDAEIVMWESAKSPLHQEQKEKALKLFQELLCHPLATEYLKSRLEKNILTLQQGMP
ncbi:hypothetical protein [Rhabdochlamydiaceae symbiont of Dictyostelium giganteum]|uniref:tetratricopeptide repeat protein n=1 Tax=Rhabdochlamydiaceae symbiont of Dictyostelium giganteum TaxID=3342349 RepID=UPI00384E5788